MLRRYLVVLASVGCQRHDASPLAPPPAVRSPADANVPVDAAIDRAVKHLDVRDQDVLCIRGATTRSCLRLSLEHGSWGTSHKPVADSEGTAFANHCTVNFRDELAAFETMLPQDPRTGGCARDATGAVACFAAKDRGWVVYPVRGPAFASIASDDRVGYGITRDGALWGWLVPLQTAAVAAKPFGLPPVAELSEPLHFIGGPNEWATVRCAATTDGAVHCWSAREARKRLPPTMFDL